LKGRRFGTSVVAIIMPTFHTLAG